MILIVLPHTHVLISRIYVPSLQETCGLKDDMGNTLRVNSTGTRRRRKGLSKGSRLAPQGRPPKWPYLRMRFPAGN